jgi:hypothetical protein
MCHARRYTLHSDQLGALPTIDAFIDRLGLDRALDTFVARLRQFRLGEATGREVLSRRG